VSAETSLEYVLMTEKINKSALPRKRCTEFIFRSCPLCLAALSRVSSAFCFHAKKQMVFFLNTSHFLTLGIVSSLLLAFFLYAVDGQPIQTQSVTAQTVVDAYAVEETEEFLPAVREIVGEIRQGESLVSSLHSNGIDSEIRQTVISAFDGLVNFREMKPNDRYTLTLDDDGSLLNFQYESGPLDIHTIERTDNGSLEARKLDVSLDCRTVKLQGRVESSLFAAFSAFKEDPKLVYNFADIFASKLDFNTEIRFGDTFELLFEKYYKNDQFVGYGKILVARYNSKEVGQLEGFYFERDGKDSAYFDHRGYELGESFIRSPVPMARVSSGFTYNRKHPILNIVRPHLGIDLAAPTGTPIMAPSDGRVKFAGWNGGYGKQIILEHAGGTKTYYGHLSNYAKNIKAGAKVRQKQIIGYIGSTGISTGPHLDYRMAQNGVFINPFGAKFRPRSQLAGTQLVLFRQEFQSLTQLARSLDDPKIVVVKNVVVTPDNPISML
jgi:murein DD-endopeptidase MepM/ murein hydrolase activator NlpD